MMPPGNDLSRPDGRCASVVWWRTRPFRRGLLIIAPVLLAAIGLYCLATSRSTLSLIVHACRFNAEISDSPLPCLAVHRPDDERDGYAVLREPASRRRMILSPLALVTGIEDPRLLADGAPNFFADAWNERSRLLAGRSSVDPWRDLAVALNSRDNRSQDHLHIHIACVRPGVRHELERSFSTVPPTEGHTAILRLRSRLYWVRRIDADDLQRVNPIQFVARHLPARTDIGSLAIVVVGAQSSDGRRGFYILAGGANRRKTLPASMERLLDPTCSLPRRETPPAS